jgi:hypothetical protein
MEMTFQIGEDKFSALSLMLAALIQSGQQQPEPNHIRTGKDHCLSGASLLRKVASVISWRLKPAKNSEKFVDVLPLALLERVRPGTECLHAPHERRPEKRPRAVRVSSLERHRRKLG